jgi:CheY-like chemotaxis protein
MKTVLVVNHDPTFVKLVSLLVEQDRYTILDATSANQAFDRFEESDGQVDLLIADVALPIFSGIGVALELQALLPYLGIVLTTDVPVSMWSTQDVAELDQLPDAVILQKPFDPTILLDTIHCLIGLPCEPAPGLKMKLAS